MSTVSKTSLDSCALSMMSNTYFFQHSNPVHSSLRVIGDARVIAVVINEDSPPDICIHPVSDKYPGFYSFADLLFSSPVSLAG